MADLTFNAERVGEYAKLADDGARTLAEAGERVGAPLEQEAFGSLGRGMRVPASYERAATVLREQLTRGTEALTSVSDGLVKVTSTYQTADDDNVRAIKRGDQR
jgi:hypothetical protein